MKPALTELRHAIERVELRRNLVGRQEFELRRLLQQLQEPRTSEDLDQIDQQLSTIVPLTGDVEDLKQEVRALLDQRQTEPA